MPENQKGDIGGSGSSFGTSTQAGVDTLTEQDVATRYGLKADQVRAFCQEFSVPTHGDHYAIPSAMLPRLESWAEQKGYAISKT